MTAALIILLYVVLGCLTMMLVVHHRPEYVISGDAPTHLVIPFWPVVWALAVFGKLDDWATSRAEKRLNR